MTPKLSHRKGRAGRTYLESDLNAVSTAVRAIAQEREVIPEAPRIFRPTLTGDGLLDNLTVRFLQILHLAG